MRVISLGIRTVPVLSVAKKLAAPRPTPTAPAAKCGLIRQDEADWLWLSIGCWKTFALLFFYSLLEVITGRGERTQYSKLTCFAKRMLDMVPGDSGEWDRRSVSAATVKLQIFVRYLFSYFRLETGSYVLIFVLSRVCEEYDVEIQWLQSKKKFSYDIKFRTFSKVRNVRK